jgi:hypothetical protein
MDSDAVAAAAKTGFEDAMDDARAEPDPGAPPATPTWAQMISYTYFAWRNKVTQTATEYTLFKDDGTTEMVDTSVSDDGTTYTRGEMTAP